MWKTVENGVAVRPSEVDAASSRVNVYIRRNFVLVPATHDAPEHYKWEEMRIPRDALGIYEQVRGHDGALDDVYAALTELAEMIVGEG